MRSDGPGHRTTKAVIKPATKKPSTEKRVKPSSPKRRGTEKKPGQAITTVEIRNTKDTKPAKKAMSANKAAQPGAVTKNIAATKKRSDIEKVAKKSLTDKPATAAKKKVSKAATKKTVLKEVEKTTRKAVTPKRVARKSILPEIKKTTSKEIAASTGKAKKITATSEKKTAKKLPAITKTKTEKKKGKLSETGSKRKTALKKESDSAIKTVQKAVTKVRQFDKTSKTSAAIITKGLEKAGEKKKIRELTVKPLRRTTAISSGKAASAPEKETPASPVQTWRRKKEKALGQQLIASSASWKEPVEPVKKPLKVFLPAEADLGISLGMSLGEISAELPAEYGENELLIMAVDPDVVYFNWEVKEEDIPGESGSISMRVFDVTGIDFDSTNAHGFQEISLKSRVGSGFFNLGLHGRDIIAEIGFLSAGGKFTEVLRSEKIAIPELVTPDDLGIGQQLFESGKPVGY